MSIFAGHRSVILCLFFPFLGTTRVKGGLSPRGAFKPAEQVFQITFHTLRLRPVRGSSFLSLESITLVMTPTDRFPKFKSEEFT